MQQLNESVLVFNAGEEIPVNNLGDYLKIALVGSEEMAMGQETQFAWQESFSNALAALTSNETTYLPLKNQKFAIFNPKAPISNPQISLDNPEFVTKYQWKANAFDMADGIFCNFLKRSQSPIPLFEFGEGLRSGKMVVRCPDQYALMPLVRQYCEKYGVPFLSGGSATALTVIQSFFSYVPRFQELQKYKLPE